MANDIPEKGKLFGFDLQNARSVLFVSMLLFVLVVWVFSPSLQGNFLVHDDYGYVTGNPNVNNGLSWTNFIWAFSNIEHDNWHPLTWLSHMVDVQLYGLNPWGHHLTNVLLHALNTVLVFLVFRRMTGAEWRSLMVAGLFGLHPLRAESVAWISERKDVLSTLFWLLAMWTYARFAEESKETVGKTKLFYGLTLLFFVMGLMSKTMLVTLPFVFLLLDYWPLKRGVKFQQLVSEKIPFFALIVIVSTAAYVAQQKGGALREMNHLSFAGRFENALVSYVRYLGKFFWPEDLCSYYPHPGHWPTAIVLAAAFIIIGISFLAWTKRTQRPYLFVGWFWFIGVLIPVIGLVQLGSDAMADRYTYIPLIGICLLLVWGSCELTKSWQFQTAVLATLTVISIAACIFLTRIQIGFWKDDITVWNRVIAATKDNYVAHDNLGAILYSTKPDMAFLHFQEATRINPNYVPALRNLAGVLYVEGRADAAVLPALKAAELDPSGATSENELNSILFNNNNQSETVNNFLEAVRLEPRDFSNYLDVLLLDTNRVGFMNELAWIFATNPDPKLRNSQFAVRLAKRTCEITDFQIATYVRTLAAAYAADSRFGESASTFLKAAELNPSDAAIENELVSILLNKSYRSETVSNFLEAVRLEPRDFSNYVDVLLLDTNRVEFMNELAWIFATNPDPKLRNSQFAVRLAKRACELTNYKQTICVGTLAAAYAEAGQFDDAILTAQKACDLATQHDKKDLLQKSQERLELYRAHKPYHETQAVP